MIKKIDLFLAFIVGCASFGVFFGIAGTKFLGNDQGNAIIGFMFFLIPMILTLILFKFFKLDSTAQPKKGYSY